MTDKDCGRATACLKNAWKDDEGYHDCPGYLADGRLCVCDCHVTEPEEPDYEEDRDLVQLIMISRSQPYGANYD